MTALLPLLAVGQDSLLVLGLVFLRVGAIMALLPAFGEQAVPVRVRLGVTIAFTAILAPAAWPQVEAVATQENLLAAAGAEVFCGLAIGISFRLAVVALQMAGAIAGNASSLSQVFGGAAADPQPAIGNVLVMGGLALAAMSGLHHKILEAMLYGYQLFPPGRIPGADVLAEWGTAQVARAFSLAFSLAAPFTIASLLYNLALGAINKAMPQLMVAMVGAPAITLGGLALTALCAPFLLQLWLDWFDGNIAALGQN